MAVFLVAVSSSILRMSIAGPGIRSKATQILITLFIQTYLPDTYVRQFSSFYSVCYCRV